MSFRLHVLGSGDAFNTGGRGSACLLFEPAGGAPFLVDLGPTAVLAMEREGVTPRDAGAVFLTHLHGDHIAGWPFFLLHNMYSARRDRPLDVHGARGMTERLAQLSAACYGDVLAPMRLPFEVRHHEMEVRAAAGLETAIAGLSIDVAPMDHDPSSIGYRFRSGGASVAVTGDTRWCAGLRDLARECDLLVMECTTVHRQDHAHVSLDELRAGRRDLAAREILLVHTSDAIAEALAGDPVAGVRAASDGLKLGIG